MKEKLFPHVQTCSFLNITLWKLKSSIHDEYGQLNIRSRHIGGRFYLGIRCLTGSIESAFVRPFYIHRQWISSTIGRRLAKRPAACFYLLPLNTSARGSRPKARRFAQVLGKPSSAVLSIRAGVLTCQPALSRWL